MVKRECWKEGYIGESMALRQGRGLDKEEMGGLSVVYIKLWSSWVTA
jgi:hypothetical protein